MTPVTISSSITAILSSSNSLLLSLSIATSILLSSICPLANAGSTLSTTSTSNYSHALILMHPSTPCSLTPTHLLTTPTL